MDFEGGDDALLAIMRHLRLMQGGARRTRLPMRTECLEEKPDVSQIQRHELAGEVLAETARPSPFVKHSKPQPTVYKLLKKREESRLRLGGFSQAERCSISCRFLPNRATQCFNLGHYAFCGIFSEDGDIFMSACQDETLRLLDTRGGAYRVMKKIQCRDVHWSVLDCDYSANRRHIAYSSWSQYVHLCNVNEEEDGDNRHESLDFRPPSDNFGLFSIKFSNDSCLLIGGSNDGAIYVYDLVKGVRSMKIPGHDDDVNTVAVAKDCRHIVHSGSDDGLCKTWDTRTFSGSRKKAVGVLTGHSAGIVHVTSKCDGRYLLTSSKDQTIKLWDIRKMSTQPVEAPGTHFDYRYEAGEPAQRRDDDVSLMTYTGHTVLRTLIRARFSPPTTTAESYVYSGSYDGSVYIWDVLTGKRVAKLDGHKQIVRDVSWHPYHNTLVSSAWDNRVLVWEYRDDVDGAMGFERTVDWAGRRRRRRW